MTVCCTVLLGALLFGLVGGSGARADELADQAPAQIERGIEAKHPAAYYILAAKLLREDRRDEAVFWFYLGQLRARAHLAARPDLEPSGDPALFASFNAVLGQPINQYAFGDIPALVRTIDAVLDWDRDHPDSFTPQSRFQEAHTKSRQGLSGLRDEITARREEIRAERARNGLGNR